MVRLRETIGQIGVRAALSAPTPTQRKQRLMKLYQYGIIRPSLLQWAIAVNGLKES